MNRQKIVESARNFAVIWVKKHDLVVILSL